MEWSLAVIAAAVLLVAAFSRALTGTPVTPAMVFVGLGLVLGPKVLNGQDRRVLCEVGVAPFQRQPPIVRPAQDEQVLRQPDQPVRLLGGVPEDQLKAEEEFASIVVDPKINAEFAFLKGSSPVRVDVPTDKLDECNTLVLDSLKKPDFSVENPFYIGDGDWINPVWNTMYTFQCDERMSTEDVLRRLRSEHRAIFR